MIDAYDALQLLRDGNRRFVSNVRRHDSLAGEARRVEVATGQEPFAIILGCSDSRVPAEIVFDQGLGDLFVIRVAGNIVAPSQVGSVEFAAERFGTRLVVVLGHSQCGAILATHRGTASGRRATSRATCIRSSTACDPSVEALLRTELRRDPDALVRDAVRANIRVSAEPPAARLGHPRAAHPARTACSSSAPSIRWRPASSTSSTACPPAGRIRDIDSASPEVSMRNAVVFALVVCFSASLAAQDTQKFEIDPFWPKPLPDKWIIGRTGSICADAHDHLVVTNRRDITAEEAETSIQAPSVLIFDLTGNLVHSFGDSNTVPGVIHGCFVDHEYNIWLTGNGDGIVQKWTHDGKAALRRSASATSSIRQRHCPGAAAQLRPDAVLQSAGDCRRSRERRRVSRRRIRQPPRGGVR